MYIHIYEVAIAALTSQLVFIPNTLVDLLLSHLYTSSHHYSQYTLIILCISIILYVTDRSYLAKKMIKQMKNF